MQLLGTNKQTNTSEIYGGVTAFLRHNNLEDTVYKSRLETCFSRNKLNVFEDDNYKLERKETIKASRK